MVLSSQFFWIKVHSLLKKLNQLRLHCAMIVRHLTNTLFDTHRKTYTNSYSDCSVHSRILAVPWVGHVGSLLTTPSVGGGKFRAVRAQRLWRRRTAAAETGRRSSGDWARQQRWLGAAAEVTGRSSSGNWEQQQRWLGATAAVAVGSMSSSSEQPQQGYHFNNNQ